MVRIHKLLARARELRYLARDFVHVINGTDYFHAPQPLGLFEADQRCYYNDLRRKANWNGKYVNGVPALYVPKLNSYVSQPVMILQYGLGCLDSYFVTNNRKQLDAAVASAMWTIQHLGPDCYLDNNSDVLKPHESFWSNNSAMAQGQALSLLSRIAQYAELPADESKECVASANAVFANMVKLKSLSGTVIDTGDRLVFCEFCNKDDSIVLNGWIFALFGVWDHWKMTNCNRAQEAFQRSLTTLENEIDSYILPGGWSLYDNRGRISSPFYHSTQIHLVDALARLTGSDTLVQAQLRMRKGNSTLNKIYFTLNKTIDRITDRGLHGSSRIDGRVLRRTSA